MTRVSNARATGVSIEPLVPPVSDADITQLADLLIDAVAGGSAVSFLAPLSNDEAARWWRGTIAAARPKAILLVARDDHGIVGTVQLHPAWAPNQPHRGDIAKLIVHRRARGGGLGTRLMVEIEDAARRAGYGLLTLDTKRGDTAERLYERLGWTRAGVIPRYAVDPDGVTPHDTVIFFKEV